MRRNEPNLDQPEPRETCPACKRPIYNVEGEPLCGEEPDFCSVACAQKYDADTAAEEEGA